MRKEEVFLKILAIATDIGSGVKLLLLYMKTVFFLSETTCL